MSHSLPSTAEWDLRLHKIYKRALHEMICLLLVATKNVYNLCFATYVPLVIFYITVLTVHTKAEYSLSYAGLYLLNLLNKKSCWDVGNLTPESNCQNIFQNRMWIVCYVFYFKSEVRQNKTVFGFICVCMSVIYTNSCRATGRDKRAMTAAMHSSAAAWRDDQRK